MIRGMLFDLDGTVYRGEEPVPGAADFIAGLSARGIEYLFVTNRSSRSPEAICEHLRSLAIPCEPRHVLTTAEATAEWLGAGRKVYCIGGPGLAAAIVEHGSTIVDEPPDGVPDDGPDDVVVGLDPGLTYAKLAAATRFIRAGARFVGTNPDRVFSTETGVAPGAGATLAALTAATGVEPTVIGKPEPIIFESALQRLGLPSEEVVMVGDNLDTDVAGGRRAGLRTAWILTGVSTREELGENDPQPTWITASYPRLATRLFETDSTPAA